MKNATSFRGNSSPGVMRHVSPGIARITLAILLCAVMLGIAVFAFLPVGSAQEFPYPRSISPFAQRPKDENILEALLNLPAPPPPNPLENGTERDESFYDPKKPPPDDAAIEDLVDYWSRQSETYRGSLYYLPKPSEKTAERLLMYVQKDPSQFNSLSKVLPDDKRTADVIKSIYDGLGETGESRELRAGLKSWLTVNSNYYADELERIAGRTRDSGGYVDLPHETNVLALTKHDWARAKPIIERMYNDASNPVTKVLATWAFYKHAIEASDLGDVERYRSELMRTVEDRNLPDGVRDKANDAIAHEADFPGRDDWTFSLFEDETLVKMDRFTMLTTLIMYEPPEKHIAKLTALLDSKNKLVLYAAVRCLTVAYDRGKDAAIIKALLPWLADPKWVDMEPDSPVRMTIVFQLATTKMPEAVPGLIAALDERATRVVEDAETSANANSVNTARIMVFPSRTNSNTDSSVKARTETYFPLRQFAIRALAFQADQRAAPALKRLLTAPMQEYEYEELIRAIFACGGYSAAEQVDALEYSVKVTSEVAANIDRIQEQFRANTNTSYNAIRQYVESQVPGLAGRMTGEGRDLKFMLGTMVAANTLPGNEVVSLTIARINELEKKDPELARALKQVVTTWRGTAISLMLLNELKNGRAEVNAIVRLLAERKSLREALPAEVAEISSGSPIAAAVSACILDDARAFGDVLGGKNVDEKIGLYGCARLVRAELPLAKASADLKSENALLKSAAEHYLESEDSDEARSMVLAQHPGEAKILGATSYFRGRGDNAGFAGELIALFASFGTSGASPYAYGDYYTGELSKSEEALQKEVKGDDKLSGVYAYSDNYVRIYKDKVVFSWQDDPSRYHERSLSKEEFDALRQLMAAHNVAELKPFLACYRGCGTARELVMLGKAGGSRVFVRSDRTPKFFAALEKLLEEFRSQPAAIKYSLSKDVPGLELLFARDDLEAQTVWKQGADLRLAVSNAVIRDKVEEEISKLEESDEDEDTNDENEPNVITGLPEAPATLSPAERMRERRQYESYAWHSVENGMLGAPVAQPAGVEFIPVRDAFEIQPDQQQWKARTNAAEIRANSTGIYRVAGAKITKLAAGEYSLPVVSPNGRWVVLNKINEDEGPSVVRFNLATKREFKINYDGYGMLSPKCYIPAVGKFLLAADYYEEEYEASDNEDEQGPAADDETAHRYYLLDAETGALTPAYGVFRPLVHQTFRPLQPAGKPNQFWAAIPNGDKHETVIGVYDARTFKFTPVRTLPKIIFKSMDMWVDASEGKVYFVYNGHLLRVPLANKK
jgi:hypothetical protein